MTEGDAGFRKGRPSTLIIVSVVIGLILVGYATVGSTFAPYMYSESNGRRQYDYKFFNVIPYSRIERVPGLKIEKKVADTLASAGLTLPKTLTLDPKNAECSWMHYETGNRSYVRFKNATNFADLHTFFRSQAGAGLIDTKVGGTWSLTWRSTDGKYNVRVSAEHTRPPLATNVPDALVIDVSPYQAPRTVAR